MDTQDAALVRSLDEARGLGQRAYSEWSVRKDGASMRLLCGRCLAAARPVLGTSTP